MSEINELKKTITNHEKRIVALEKILSSQYSSVVYDDESAILSLIKKGFFDKPKKLNNIKKELKIQAKFNIKAKYGDILKKLTSEEKLQRKQVHHQWAYVKGD